MTENSYEGITHGMTDGFLDDPRFVKVWKERRCSKGIHLLDEVWSNGEHYLHCDVCSLIINIASIDKEYVE